MGKKKQKGKDAENGGSKDDPSIDTFLIGAARLRVAGFSWDKIAKDFQRKLDTVKHWPGRYPKRWARYMREAIDEALGDIENDALTVAKDHLKAKTTVGVKIHDAKKDGPKMERIEIPNGDLRQKAAGTLLSHCRELRGTKLKLEGGDPDKPLLSIVIKKAQKPKKKSS